ncbi:hypothetical protein [Embleya sp. NPDC001921]
MAVLAGSTACGGDDKKKAAAPLPASGSQTPGSASSAAPGTPPVPGATGATGAASPTAASTGKPLRPCAPVTATDKPTRGTLTREDLRSAQTDPKPVTVDEVFGVAQLPYKYQGGTLTRTCVKVLEDCSPMASGEAAELIKRLGCVRAVSALYVDKANNVQTTVGVLTMPTAIAAATLAQSNAGYYNQVTPPTNRETEVFAPEAAYTWIHESLYRYFIYEMTGRMDGKDRDPGEVAKHTAATNAVYHLVGDSLDRRAAGEPSQSR